MEVQHSTARGADDSSGAGKHCCSVCGLVASTSGKLKLHQLRHSAEKPFQCEVCAARFRQRSVLKVHAFTHTRLSPHRCSRCGRHFATKSKLGKAARKFFLFIHLYFSLYFVLRDFYPL
jgi:KRAB domain-containing zinc finger protein